MKPYLLPHRDSNKGRVYAHGLILIPAESFKDSEQTVENSVETSIAPVLLITEPDSNADTHAISRSYDAALKVYLGRGPGADLTVARRLGRRGLRLDLNTLEFARIHEASLTSLKTPGSSKRSTSARNRRAETFFYAVVAPIEENHLAESESTGRHKSIISTLTRRARDLAEANEKLRKAIEKCKEAEESLHTTETTTSLLLKRSRAMQEEMRLLSRRLFNVQEDERKRISRELHDVIAQNLAGINVRLAVLRSMTTASAKDFHEKIGVTERLVEQSVEIVHQFASELRPLVLDDLGLIPALESFSNSFTKRTGIPVSMTAPAIVETLEIPILTALFRIVQEALNNTARHAKATHVKINLRSAKGLVQMKIVDDGRGFDPKKTGSARGPGRLGLLGMRERAEMVGGTFVIDSTIGKGTTVCVEIPYRESSSPGRLVLHPRVPIAIKKSP